MEITEASAGTSTAAACVAAQDAPTPRGTSIWLSTPNWLLLPVTASYAPLMARMHEKNGDHFLLGMSLEPQMSQAAFWEPILERQQQAFQHGGGVFLAGFYKKHVRPEIGCAINFSGIVHDEFRSCWLGYRLDKSLEGRGLMHEAVAWAIRKVMHDYKLHRVMASHQPDNLRSGRLLRRLGFGIEGYARDFMYMNGAWRDNVLLALLATEVAKERATERLTA